MARTFGSGKYLKNTASACVTAVPLTIACWFNFSSTGGSNTAFLGLNGQNYYGLVMGYVTAGRVGALTASTTHEEVIAETSTSFSTNTWAHGCAVFSAANSRTAYLNGGGSTINTTTMSPGNMIVQSIGCFWDTANAWGVANGIVAEVGMWNVALTASEIAALAAGVPTIQIRPESLAGYWPIFGIDSPEGDFHPGIVSATRRVMTMTGTAALANHAPIAPPFFPRFPRHTYSGMEEEAAAPILIDPAGGYASSSSYGRPPIICPIGF